ncbi:MAG: hypothetical protein E6J41_15275 [Chloroflexi bacterium]|nr:MAG: hypothetical protein E6J41_15275 [Chloroflexota bacterium]
MNGGEDTLMDPNAALVEIRRLLARGRFEDLAPTDSHRLVELVEGLDGWIAGGGFLPALWLTGRSGPANVEQDQRWWWVTPVELAIRYGGDTDRLLDTLNPEDEGARGDHQFRVGRTNFVHDPPATFRS